jgi:hypothetical protein
MHSSEEKKTAIPFIQKYKKPAIFKKIHFTCKLFLRFRMDALLFYGRAVKDGKSDDSPRKLKTLDSSQENQLICQRNQVKKKLLNRGKFSSLFWLLAQGIVTEFSPWFFE